MTQPYPLPRETRETEILAGTGGATYGPFGFKIFDTADVIAMVRPEGSTFFGEAEATVAKVNGDPFDNFTVTFAETVPLGASFKIVSARLHERQIAVTKGGAISAVELEKELSKQGSVLEELRRDVDRAVKGEYGASVPKIATLGPGRFFTTDEDGNLVDGGSAEDIKNAEVAAAAAAAAALAAQEAAASIDYRVVADRTAAKSLNPALVRAIIVVGEGGRDGTFAMRAKSDMSASELTGAAADTSEGIYIPIGADHYAVRQAGWAIECASAAWWGVDTSAADTASAYQAAIDACEAIGIARLAGVPGVNILGATINMRPGITIDGINRTVEFKQADGANRPSLFEFFNGGLFADKARIINCIVDGNLDNNAVDLNVCLIHTRASQNVDVEGNIVRNSPGHAIVTAGKRSRVLDNWTYDNMGHGVWGMFAGTFEDMDTDIAGDFSRNTILRGRRGNMFFTGIDNSRIHANRIVGLLIGGRGMLTVATSNGNTVDWVSGPTFEDVKVGMILVIEQGKEFVVDQVVSPTRFIVQTEVGHTLATDAAAEAMVGSPDGIGVQCSKDVLVDGNFVSNISTFGMGMSMGGLDIDSDGVVFSNNTARNVGKIGISIAWDGSGTAKIKNTVLRGNKLTDVGIGADAVGALDKVGIVSYSVSEGNIVGTHIDDNDVSCTFDSYGKTNYWLAFDEGSGAGTAILGNNRSDAVHGSEVLSDIKSITTGVNWGDAAAVTEIISTGVAVQFKITSAGTGQAEVADFTVSKITDTSDTPKPQCSIVSAAGALDVRFPVASTHLSTRGSWKGAVLPLPTAGDILVFQMNG